jgi:hypothetical protein
LHYKKLLEAHKAFYTGEHRAGNYDRYMLEQKDWKKWENPIVPFEEIKKLFRFIRSWDRFFQGDPEVFQKIYKEIYPIIQRLKHEKIEDADFTDKELKAKIRDVFDKVADCTSVGRFESTDASKILHTILPNFFVMWDDEIKNWTVQGRRMGATYAFDFLPKVQRELEETIKTCMTERKLNRAEAIKYIREATGGQTLAKLADEYNYMKYTMRHLSLWESEV